MSATHSLLVVREWLILLEESTNSKDVTTLKTNLLIWLVPTPIGNIADISLRTLDVLSKAEIFLCEDTRVTKQLLLILQERYNLQLQENKEFYSLHSHNEQDFFEKTSLEFFEKNVVYVSDAGMPGVSDPGSMLVDFAQKHNLQYEVLPGANAVLTAYVASGMTQTQFLFFGFLPHKGKEREAKLQEALFSGYVTVLYESPHRLLKLLKELEKAQPNRMVFLAKELTKKYERFFKGTPSELLAQVGKTIKGEWVVVIDAAQTKQQGGAITTQDILELDIPKKQKAKLLSKITNKSVKELYNGLI